MSTPLPQDGCKLLGIARALRAPAPGGAIGEHDLSSLITFKKFAFLEYSFLKSIPYSLISIPSKREMLELIQFPWSPFCIVQRRILEYSGARFKITNIPNGDRSLVWKVTRQRYYQVP